MAAQLATPRLSAGVDLLLAWLRPRTDAIARSATALVCEQIDDYRERDDEALRREVETHFTQVYATFLTCLAERRDPTAADFAWTPTHALRRVDLGVGLPAFLQAFRVGQLEIWDAVLAAVEEHPDAKDAALAVGGQLMQLVEVASISATEAYLEAQQFTLADHARLTRDLLDDLLEGRPPTMARRQEMLADVGITEESPLVVAVGSFAVPGDDSGTKADHALLRTALNNPGRGLTVARHDEVVAVLPVERGEEHTLARIRAAMARLAGHGVFPSVGVSAVQRSLLEIPAAYEEACLARRSLRGRTGVQALGQMSTLDYLVQTHDRTARRLVPPEVRTFVEEDLAAGGSFVATLRAYVACDLNAKLAALQLHVHANTVYYRLERISERTGCDVRRVESVIDLLIAVSIVTGARD